MRLSDILGAQIHDEHGTLIGEVADARFSDSGCR
jgi:sporulation protein YlmC with PRC-barrel domain